MALIVQPLNGGRRRAVAELWHWQRNLKKARGHEARFSDSLTPNPFPQSGAYHKRPRRPSDEFDTPLKRYSLLSTTMPEKVVETPYPLIDADPHAGRVLRYMRPSDLGVWAAATGAFPAALYFWGEHHKHTKQWSCWILIVALYYRYGRPFKIEN